MSLAGPNDFVLFLYGPVALLFDTLQDLVIVQNKCWRTGYAISIRGRLRCNYRRRHFVLISKLVIALRFVSFRSCGKMRNSLFFSLESRPCRQQTAGCGIGIALFLQYFWYEIIIIHELFPNCRDSLSKVLLRHQDLSFIRIWCIGCIFYATENLVFGKSHHLRLVYVDRIFYNIFNPFFTSFH